MTQEQAKEKAKELYLKFRNYTNDCTSVNKPYEHFQYIIELGMKDGRAKQCALICINEMLNISDDSNEQRFLEQVKQEIEKL
jgi:hypothetical protein